MDLREAMVNMGKGRDNRRVLLLFQIWPVLMVLRAGHYAVPFMCNNVPHCRSPYPRTTIFNSTVPLPDNQAVRSLQVREAGISVPPGRFCYHHHPIPVTRSL